MTTPINALGTLVFWLIILGVAVFVFFIIMSFMIQCRKMLLQKQIDAIPTNQLRIGVEDLGSMHGIIAETWTRRGTIHPKPEKAHIAKGWVLNDDGKPYCIRNFIRDSIKRIEENAIMVNPNYKRKPSMPVASFMEWLSKQRGIHIEGSTLSSYLSFYNAARYGPTTLKYSEDDLASFNTVFTSMMSSFRSR